MKAHSWCLSGTNIHWFTWQSREAIIPQVVTEAAHILSSLLITDANYGIGKRKLDERYNTCSIVKAHSAVTRTTRKEGAKCRTEKIAGTNK